MAWTDPTAWDVGDVLTKDRLNQEVRDNLIALKDPPSANFEGDGTANYSTTSTTFVDVDDPDFVLTITTNGGDVLVHFHGNVYNTGANGVSQLDVEVDGTRIGYASGMMYAQEGNSESTTFTRLITGLSAGSHTFKLQWKVLAGTGVLTGLNYSPQFWAREVS